MFPPRGSQEALFRMVLRNEWLAAACFVALWATLNTLQGDHPRTMAPVWLVDGKGHDPVPSVDNLLVSVVPVRARQLCFVGNIELENRCATSRRVALD
jgi:hypothetical protein